MDGKVAQALEMRCSKPRDINCDDPASWLRRPSGRGPDGCSKCRIISYASKIYDIGGTWICRAVVGREDKVHRRLSM
jgi:hypothetical protein